MLHKIFYIYIQIYHINLHVHMRATFQNMLNPNTFSKQRRATDSPSCTTSASGFFEFCFYLWQTGFSHSSSLPSDFIFQKPAFESLTCTYIYIHTVSYSCEWVSSYAVTRHCITRRKVKSWNYCLWHNIVKSYNLGLMCNIVQRYSFRRLGCRGNVKAIIRK